MKWRAERSASSHRFHCAILWPRSSCLFFRLKHTHVNLDSLEGARCRGLSPEHKNDGRREKRMGTVGPSRCLWMMPSSSPLFMLPFKDLYSIYSEPTLNIFSVISDFHIKCSTRWPTAGQGREINVALISGAFIFIRKRKETWLAFHHYLHFYTHTGATWDSPVRRPAVVWESRMQLNVKAVKEEVMWRSRAACRTFGAPRSGTLSVMFLCEERAVEREWKVASRRLSGEHRGLIGV